jgi:hypothetical protein
VWSSRPLFVPTDLVVVDDLWLRWTSVKKAGDEWPPIDGLLDAFCDLASSDPHGMAAFVSSYGILELCAKHNLPDAHLDNGQRCTMDHDGDGHAQLWVWAIQHMATAVAAARRIGRDLSYAKPGSVADWVDLQQLIKAAFRRPDYYKQGRQFFGEILTTFLRACRVRPLVRWEESQKRPAVTVEADGLMSAIALLLRREIATGTLAYQCSVCGDVVERSRSPRDGETVYCEKAECKKEQQRRNQTAYRARIRATKGT